MPHRRSSRTKTASPRHGEIHPAGKRGIDVAAWCAPILLALLAANSVALLVHAWLFLPGNDNDVRLLLPLNPPSGDRGTTADETPLEAPRSFERRVRAFDAARAKDAASAASEALRTTLSKDPVVRYDVVPRVLAKTRGYYGVVHQLPSIPDRRRMVGGEGSNVPPDAARNLTYFLESRMRPDEEDRPLFLYNPMVLPLDAGTIDGSVLSDLSGGDGDHEERASYVALYRVSNFGNCHGPGRGVPDTYRNYLGLALLDRDLNILRDSNGDYLDAVIDLNQHLYDIRWSPFLGMGGRIPINKLRQYMQDCQLFADWSSGDVEKADRLMLLCNEYAMPVRLQRRGNNNNNNNNDPNDPKNTNTNTRGNNRGGRGGRGNKESQQIHFKNSYGTGLQLTALQRPDMIMHRAKNMHYIPASAATTGGFLEMWPGGPHEFMRVDFSTYPYVNRGRRPNGVVTSSAPEPDPSFATVDGETPAGGRSPLIDRDSGSACCVSVLWGGDGGRRLLLGISHRKTHHGVRKAIQYNYVSRAYAFEPTPPFDVVARSGYFCLGFAPDPDSRPADDEALQSDNEQLGGAAHDYKLKIHNTVFNCPRIHFITGIAEKVGDEGTVIVSYGVNDCYPRMVEVSKDFLVGLLEGSKNRGVGTFDDHFNGNK